MYSERMILNSFMENKKKHHRWKKKRNGTEDFHRNRYEGDDLSYGTPRGLCRNIIGEEQTRGGRARRPNFGRDEKKGL